MKKISRYLLFLCLCHGSVTYADAAVEVMLSPVVTMKCDKRLKLTDLAKITFNRPFGSIVINKLSDIVIPDKYIDKSLITKLELRELIQQSNLVDISDVAIYGDKVAVRPAVRNIKAENIENLALEFVRRKLGNRFGDVELNISSVMQDELVLTEEVKFHPYWMSNGVPKSHEKVFVEVINSTGKIIQTIPIWVDIKITHIAYVALHDIPAHARLSTSDFYETSSMVTKNIFPLENDPSLYISDHLIRSGNVLLEGSVKQAPAVVRGDVIKVESVSGHAVILLTAIANMDGNIGDKIMAININSNKKFYGVVKSDKHMIVGDINEM